MRVTGKYILAQVNELLVNFEMPWTAKEISFSKFTENQYECGAWQSSVRIEHNDHPDSWLPTWINCYYPLSYLQKALNKGYVLTLKMKGNTQLISDIEIEIIKK